MIDHRMAQAASRREGVKFNVALPPRPRAVGHNRKLTPTDVADVRRWALGEGFGLSRVRQVDALMGRYSVSREALIDVLTNGSWYDPTYQPDAPDPAYWGAATVPQAMLRVLVGRRRREGAKA